MALFLPDATVLINAFRKGAPHHAPCAKWLADTGLADALRFWGEDLWSHPRIHRIHANASHNTILSHLITELGLTDNDVNDAWLAALAIEHHAILVSLDRGFARFPGLDWLDLSAS